MTKSIRIAHLSDPHFASITYSPGQFFSKRWLGNCNLILFRHKTHQTDHLSHLPALFHSLGVEYVALTGDCTTTSLDQEYSKAKEFVDSFGLPTMVLPGNHDIYTKESERSGRFYHYFPSEAKESKIEVRKLKEGFWWIGLHCAYASNLFLSNGKFTPQMEHDLYELLASLPKEELIVMGNHFPLLSTGNPRHDLSGAKRLQAVVQHFPNIRLYLHGHDHIPYLIDKRRESLPLICNSGSISHLPGGSFYLIELSLEKTIVQRYSLAQNSLSVWNKVDEVIVTWL